GGRDAHHYHWHIDRKQPARDRVGGKISEYFRRDRGSSNVCGGDAGRCDGTIARIGEESASGRAWRKWSGLPFVAEQGGGERQESAGVRQCVARRDRRANRRQHRGWRL